jgi:hypothetical protein
MSTRRIENTRILYSELVSFARTAKGPDLTKESEYVIQVTSFYSSSVMWESRSACVCVYRFEEKEAYKNETEKSLGLMYDSIAKKFLFTNNFKIKVDQIGPQFLSRFVNKQKHAT